mgnify:FL=1
MSKAKLALWLFILSTLFSGVVWEAVGWISLIYCCKLAKSNRFTTIKKESVPEILLLLLVFGYVIMQCFLLQLNTANIIRLFGITKTLFALPIIILLLKDFIYDKDIILEILPLLLVIDWITIISLITNNESLNILGGSRNYLGAINVILFPYIFKFFPAKLYKRYRNCFFVTLMLLTIFSGSRTLMLTTAISFGATVILEKDLNKKLRYFLFVMLVVLIGLFTINSVASESLVARGLSVFSNLSDASRSGLTMFAQRQYESYSNIEKLIGNGDTVVLSQMKPVHNVFYEVLLCYGKIGFVFYIAYVVIGVLFIFKCKSVNRAYLVMIVFLTLLIGWVQPFLTSGYLFQSIVSFTMIRLYYSDTPENIVNQWKMEI